MTGRNKKIIEKIQFYIGISNLGHILVAESELGLCAVLIGNSSEELLTELQRRIPNATLILNNKNSQNQFLKIIRSLENPFEKVDFQLDERGTNFQLKVWELLRQIPVGETLSYSDVAAKLGKPNASRAVGTACGSNPISIITPCHRVIKKNGDPTGYYWGLERKLKLLENEKVFLPGFTK